MRKTTEIAQKVTCERLLEIAKQLDSPSKGFMFSLLCEQDQCDKLIIESGSTIAYRYLSPEKRIQLYQEDLHQSLQTANEEEILQRLALLDRLLNETEKNILRNALVADLNHYFGSKPIHCAESFGINLDVKWMKRKLSKEMMPSKIRYPATLSASRVQEYKVIAWYIYTTERRDVTDDAKRKKITSTYRRTLRRIMNIASDFGHYCEYCKIREEVLDKEALAQASQDDASLRVRMADYHLQNGNLQEAINIMWLDLGLSQEQMKLVMDSMKAKGNFKDCWLCLQNDFEILNDFPRKFQLLLDIVEMMMSKESVKSQSDKSIYAIIFHMYENEDDENDKITRTVTALDENGTVPKKRILRLRNQAIRHGFYLTAVALSNFLGKRLTQKQIQTLFSAIVKNSTDYRELQRAFEIIGWLSEAKRKSAIRELVVLHISFMSTRVNHIEKEFLTKLREAYESIETV
jgi:hypothetical protein